MSNILTAVPGHTAEPGNTGVTGYQLDRQELHCSPGTGVSVHITKCRNSIFGLLGPIFANSCKLSPIVQLHLWRLYCLPVLKSGLSSLPLRPTAIKTMQVFQNRILRGFLKLSDSSPVPYLHFLSGELGVNCIWTC